ncbi:hypothetical protein C8J56DRAFT_588843 [Mycena floridula]|nr:hypothetical protein C8J56DRAFT_588843 [Mycena floridula]
MASETSSSSLCCRRCGNRYLDDVPVPLTREFPESRTNNARNPADIAIIQADVDVREAEILALDAQIDLLDRTSQALKSRRAAAQEAMLRNKGLLHPIRLLPVEMLREIFRHCTANGHGENYDDLKSPQNLLAVCQRWRDISTSVPELWTTIAVGYSRKTSDSMLILMLELWSSSALLDISIGPEAEYHHFLWLISSASRWKTLTLEHKEINGWMVHRFPDHFDSLTELSICFTEDAYLTELLAFKVAPLLRKVGFIYEHDGVYLDVALPWTTISELTAKTANDIKLPLSLKHLHLCQNLTILRLDGVTLESVESIRQVINFPKLSTLFVDVCGPVLSPFLNTLVAPALKSLHVRFSVPNISDNEIMSVTSLVLQSQCSLTDMQFTNMLFTTPPFIEFLSSSPSLKRLIFNDHDEADLIAGLSGLLPKLTQIGICLLDDQTHVEPLLQMLESRRQHGSLTTANLNIRCHPEASQLGRLEALRQAGLALFISDDEDSDLTFADYFF